MECNILTIGLSNELIYYLKKSVIPYKLHFVTSSTIQTANQLAYYQEFHLIIVNLEFT